MATDLAYFQGNSKILRIKSHRHLPIAMVDRYRRLVSLKSGLSSRQKPTNTVRDAHPDRQELR